LFFGYRGDNTNYNFTGGIDEYGIWARQLSDSELIDIYNDGAGLQYTADFNLAPTVTLNSPDTNQTSNTVIFNWTVEDDVQVDNSTLYIDGVLNQTITHGTSNYTSEQLSLTLGDGNYNWSVIAADDEGEENTPTYNYFSIDSTDPIVNITYPTNGTNFLSFVNPANITLNFTATDTNIDTCWFYNGTANITLTCGANSSELLGTGDHTIIYYVNDTFGNLAETSTTFNINIVTENKTYTDPAVEAETYDFNFTLTATTITDFNGTFWYNNVAQTTTYADNGTAGLLGSRIVTPTIGNITFYWNYWLDGTNYNSSLFSHNVYALQNLTISSAACPAGLDPALTYNFQDEQNSSIVNSTVDYIFRYGITNNTARTTAGTFNDIVDFNVCINSTVWNNYSIGYGETQYEATGYSDRRYYTFSGNRLTNVTINNTLYSLISGSSTSFLFTIQKSDLSVYDNVYLTLNRWYPEEDTYRVVEMSKTDDEGQTVMKVEIEDVDYRVGVYYPNGTLIYLAAPFRLVCIAAPCSYTLTVPDDAGDSFTNWKNLQVSLNFNTTTNIFDLTYNDPSQDTDTFNMSVFKDTGRSNLLICTDSAESYTGVLTCNVSGYTGTLRAVGFRTASPQTSVISKIVVVGSTALGKVPALFITMLVMIFLVSVGIVSPILTVILAVLGFIPALALGIMPLPILFIVAAMGFIVIHFIKRSAG